MTITLEEALWQATEGPVIPNHQEPFRLEGVSGEWVGYCYGGADPTLEMKSKTNIALLSHFYNIGPDLVSRLEALQKWSEQMGGFNSPQWADLPELIERANKVQLP